MAQPFDQADVKEDPVSISIGEMLKSISPTLTKPCIFRVPDFLRQVKEKAYEPQVIAIGPYHHGKGHLKAMEEQKISILQLILEEKEETDVSKYVMKMRELEEEARRCYEEPVSLDSNDLVKMLLLDGCFIVQLIRFLLNGFPIYLKDRVVCYSDCFFNALMEDILLVENQLPFCVLSELFAMIETSVDHDTFIKAIFDMCCYQPIGKMRPKEDLTLIRFEIKHLLDFTYHRCCHPSTSEMVASRETLHFDFNFNFIRCATELQEAGIEFKMIEGNSMFDVSFKNKTLHIPQINIHDATEPFLRNLIAYEQLFAANGDLKHATDYMVFMDSLINSPKDVEILCQNKIIQNMLGDNKAVADMINSLGICVTYSQNFYYAGVFDEVNKHCSKRWNKWMANLKHNHFNSPWALISLLAAALLLLLTLLQTIFSILSYTK